MEVRLLGATFAGNLHFVLHAVVFLLTRFVNGLKRTGEEGEGRKSTCSGERERGKRYKVFYIISLVYVCEYYTCMHLKVKVSVLLYHFLHCLIMGFENKCHEHQYTQDVSHNYSSFNLIIFFLC